MARSEPFVDWLIDFPVKNVNTVVIAKHCCVCWSTPANPKEAMLAQPMTWFGGARTICLSDQWQAGVNLGILFENIIYSFVWWNTTITCHKPRLEYWGKSIHFLFYDFKLASLKDYAVYYSWAMFSLWRSACSYRSRIQNWELVMQFILSCSSGLSFCLFYIISLRFVVCLFECYEVSPLGQCVKL